jgi:type II secretory pathway component GspD/PulD (secretin)
MRRLALLALGLALATSVRAAEEATIALNFQDVELPVLAKFVSEVTGRNFIVDERVHGRVTIISPTRITPDEAYLVFQSVLQVKGYTTVPSGAFVKIVPAREAREGRAPDRASRHQQPRRRRRERERRSPGRAARRSRRALERALDRGRPPPLRAR